MARRSFAVTAPPSAADPPNFELSGVGQLDGQPWAESFRCLGIAPAAALDELARAVSLDEQNNVIAFSNVSVVGFFRHVLHPEDLPRFEALVADQNRTVPIDTLGDVLIWLGEEYADRPTAPSSSSTPTPG